MGIDAAWLLLLADSIVVLLSVMLSGAVLGAFVGTSSRGGVIVFSGGACTGARPPKLGLALCSGPDPVEVGLFARGTPVVLPVIRGFVSPTNIEGDFPCLGVLFVISPPSPVIGEGDTDTDVGLVLLVSLSDPAALPVLVSCLGTASVENLPTLLSVYEAVVPENLSLMGDMSGLINGLGLVGDAGGAATSERSTRLKSRFAEIGFDATNSGDCTSVSICPLSSAALAPAPAPIASYRETISEIEPRRGEREDRIDGFASPVSSCVSSSSGRYMSEGGGAKVWLNEDFDFVISGDFSREPEVGLSDVDFCIGEVVNIDCGRLFLAGDALGVTSVGIVVDLGSVEYAFVALGSLYRGL